MPSIVKEAQSFFSDEKLFTIEESHNIQNDRELALLQMPINE